MNSLVMITNNLQSPKKRNRHLIPAEPLGIAMMEARMYEYRGDSFIATPSNKPWGNSVVYGTLYHIKDFEHWSRALDAYHDCSLSLIGRPHELDLQHRVECDIVLINPRNKESLLSLDYTELTTTKAFVYIANLAHPKIKQRVDYSKHRYRIQSGLRTALLEQWEEIWQKQPNQNTQLDMDKH